MTHAQRRAQVRRRLFWKGIVLLAAVGIACMVALYGAGYWAWQLFEALT